MQSGRRFPARLYQGRPTPTRFNAVRPIQLQLFGFHHRNDEPLRSGNIIRRRYFHAIAASHPLLKESAKIRRNNDIRLSSYNKVHYSATCPDGNNNAPATTSANNSTRVLLPTLGQNGTLVLRSNSNSIAEVQII